MGAKKRVKWTVEEQRILHEEFKLGDSTKAPSMKDCCELLKKYQPLGYFFGRSKKCIQVKCRKTESLAMYILVNMRFSTHAHKRQRYGVNARRVMARARLELEVRQRVLRTTPHASQVKR
jgi:hypothetical protein